MALTGEVLVRILRNGGKSDVYSIGKQKCFAFLLTAIETSFAKEGSEQRVNSERDRQRSQRMRKKKTPPLGVHVPRSEEEARPSRTTIRP